jgi:hypothetical protein
LTTQRLSARHTAMPDTRSYEPFHAGCFAGTLPPSDFALYGSVTGGVTHAGLLEEACRRQEADAAVKGRRPLRRARLAREEWNEVLSWRVWITASAAADTLTPLAQHPSKS